MQGWAVCQVHCLPSADTVLYNACTLFERHHLMSYAIELYSGLYSYRHLSSFWLFVLITLLFIFSVYSVFI